MIRSHKNYGVESNCIKRKTAERKTMAVYASSVHNGRRVDTITADQWYKISCMWTNRRATGYASLTRYCLLPIQEEQASSHGPAWTCPLFHYKISYSKYRALQKRRELYRVGRNSLKRRITMISSKKMPSITVSNIEN